MDDILASIRKIISDDEARAQVGGPPGPQASAPRPVPSTVIPMTPAPAQAEPPRPASIMTRAQPSAGIARPAPVARDDVLLLTDLIKEPKLGAAGPRPAAVAAPTPVLRVEPAPRVEPVARVETVTRVAPAAPQATVQRINPVRAREMPPVDPTPDQPLVGKTVAGATNSALERLSQAVQESVPTPAAPNPGPPVGASGKTIEDMVKEMLRPMLKEWLDKNLPSMVERFVEREIVRLTRR